MNQSSLRLTRGLVFIASLCGGGCAFAASLTIGSLTGPVTQTDIDSFKAYMPTQCPPPNGWTLCGGTVSHNTWADFAGGNNLEAMGMMYEISGDITILTNMISWTDYCVSQRNDLMSAGLGGQRVMWTNGIAKVWCPEPPTNTYAGGENGDTKAHILYTALLILQNPALWNQTVQDHDPFGYGATYFQRATNYVKECDEANDNYDYIFITSTNTIRDPPGWPAGFHTMEANNIQMMMLGDFQRSAQCHEILGDDPARVSYYDTVVKTASAECINGMAAYHPIQVNGHSEYSWGYYPWSTYHNNIESVGHGAYDMIGVYRVYNRAVYNFALTTVQPFANAVVDVMNVATNSFSGSVDGTGTTQNYMQQQWLLLGDWRASVYSVIAQADLSSGRYSSSPYMDAAILWMKNRRYHEFGVATAPASHLVNPGGGTSYTVSMQPWGAFNGQVGLAINGLPSGAGASFSAPAVNMATLNSFQTNVTLSVTTSASTPSAVYALTITVTNGAVAQTNIVNLVVSTNGIPDFTVSAAPAAQSVTDSGSASYTVAIGSTNGFGGDVLLSEVGLPAGATVAFDPATVNAPGSSTMTVTTSNSTPAGTSTITISGAFGSSLHSTNVNLTVTVPSAPIGLTATPGPAFISLNWNACVGAASYNVKRSTVSGGPYTNLANIGATNFTDASPSIGTTYYYVVSGVSFAGEGSNSVEVSGAPLDPGYQFSASPPTVMLNAGQGTNYTVTMTTDGAFSGSVAFGIGGLPNGTTGSFSPAQLSAAGSSTLTIQAASNSIGGNFLLTITGTNGSTVLSNTISLVLNGAVAYPGLLLWTADSGADTNWSTSLNWTNISTNSFGYGPPGVSNIVIFTNYAAVNSSAISSPGSGVVNPANVNSFVDRSFTILGLTNLANAFNTSPLYHNLGIAGGATLQINGNMMVGGFTYFDFGANNVVNMTVSGTGATLMVTNNGWLTVSEDDADGPGNKATLDLSGVDNFILTGSQIRLGVEGGSPYHRASGLVYLAKTNLLTLYNAGYGASDGSGSPYGGNPAIYIGHNSSVFGSGSQIYLGISNSIAMDYATIGRGDTNALLAFNPSFLASNPSVYIRGTSGAASTVGVYVIGDGSAGAQANNAPSTNDFSGGNVDALIAYLCVGRGRNGNNSSVGGSGVLTFDQGVISANTLAVGFMYPNGSNSVGTGTVNVNGGLLTIVNSLMMASRTNVGGSGSAQGTLNISGGTVQTPYIAGQGGTAVLNLNSGLLDAQAGSVTNLTTLNIGASGVNGSATLSNVTIVTSANAISIAANGVLLGNTVVTSPGLTVNGELSPGLNAVGTITNNGPLTLGAGGSLIVEVQDATGGAGKGWNFVQTSGALHDQATAANPFVIQLQTPEGTASNFTYATHYDWPIITAAGGIASFAANTFSVDNVLFQNDLAGGYFFARTNGNSILLSFTNNHPPAAATATWYRSGSALTIPLSQLATNWSDPDGDPVELLSVNASSTNGQNNVSTDGTNIYYSNPSQSPDAIIYVVGDVRTNPPAVYLYGDTHLMATGQVDVLFSDFGVGVTPSSQAVPPGGGTSYTISVTSSNGFAGMVALGVSGMPAGAGYSLSQTNLSGAGSSTLSVTTSNTVALGAYPITATGTSGSLVHAANMTLNVVPLAPPWITGISVIGTNVILTGTNGVPGWSFDVMASSNIIMATSNWNVMGSGMFDQNGNFIQTNSMNGGFLFFRLREP